MKTLTDSLPRNALELMALCGLIAPLSPLLGQTWAQTSAPVTRYHWQSIVVSANGQRVAAATTTPDYPWRGPIYTSGDSGSAWQSNAIAPRAWLGIAASADGTKLLAVGDGTYASTNSGTSWTFLPSPAPFIQAASSADGTRLVAVVSGGSIYLSSDSGTNWTMASGTSGRGWRSVASSADGAKLVAVCQATGSPGGSIYTSTDFGGSWLSNNAPNLLWFFVACSADGNVLVAAPGGFNMGSGPLCVSTNGGTTWLTSGSPVLAWTSVASSADGRMLIACAGGGPVFSNAIFTSTDFGATWLSNNVPAESWSSVACSADGYTLVAAAIYGGIWMSHATPQPRLSVAPGGDNNLVLSWTIPSASFILEQSPDLSSWSGVTDTPVLNLSNLHHEATLAPTNSRGFYRLAMP